MFRVETKVAWFYSVSHGLQQVAWAIIYNRESQVQYYDDHFFFQMRRFYFQGVPPILQTDSPTDW
jgi:hypothetical protein